MCYNHRAREAAMSAKQKAARPEQPAESKRLQVKSGLKAGLQASNQYIEFEDYDAANRDDTPPDIHFERRL
jgi:hypothetical protein